MKILSDFKEYLMARMKRLRGKKEEQKPTKIYSDEKTRLRPITESEPKESEKPATPLKTQKQSCVNDQHNCVALRLTNNLIQMIIEFESNIKSIENHPSIDSKTKKDIQHYMNKNIVTTIWALSPAFGIMDGYERKKEFERLFKRHQILGNPGILSEKRYI